MAKKMNWRADLQKIRNNREKADNAAKRAEEKAKKLAQRQEEAENMGILYVVRSMRLTPEELEDFLAGKPPQDKEEEQEEQRDDESFEEQDGDARFDAGALRCAGRIGAGGQSGKRGGRNGRTGSCAGRKHERKQGC